MQPTAQFKYEDEATSIIEQLEMVDLKNSSIKIKKKNYDSGLPTMLGTAVKAGENNKNQQKTQNDVAEKSTTVTVAARVRKNSLEDILDDFKAMKEENTNEDFSTVLEEAEKIELLA